MALLPPPPIGLDLSESMVRDIRAALLITWSFAVLAVILRFAVRRAGKNPFWAEDWLILVALTASAAHVFVSVTYMVDYGVGRHVWAGPPGATKAWARGLFVSELAYTITIITVKWSTLAFYWRVFATKRSIRWPIWILGGIVSAWGIAVLLISVFQCIPPSAFWERFDPVNPLDPSNFRCGVDTKKFFVGNSVPNIVTDIFIILLPLPYVWKLQLPQSQRLAVGGIFALGAFVTVISAVRLSFLLVVDLADPDITWNFNIIIIWTNIEANTAIVANCLPSLRPILRFFVHGRGKSATRSSDDGPANVSHASNSLRRLQGSQPSSYLNTYIQTRISRGGNDQHPFTRVSDGELYKTWDQDRQGPIELSMLSRGGITVTKDVWVDNSVQTGHQTESDLDTYLVTAHQ
ncbi:hypothetical protein F5B18DRAFT_630887 [Nemania serpens]|nr:hypothetical protein F5B18DRAFT_630887 [Nemania serpens]